MLNLEQNLQELNAMNNLDQLETWYQDILGKKGKLTEALKGLAMLSPEEKKEQGGKLSSMRTSLQDAYQTKFNELKTLEINTQLEKETVDISLPATELEEGKRIGM